MNSQQDKCTQLIGALTMFTGAVAVKLDFDVGGWMIFSLGMLLLFAGTCGHWFND